MEIAQIIPHVEALIFASDHPLAEIEIVDLLNNSQGFLEDLASLEQIQSAVEAVREKYLSEFYSFELKKSGGGYQFLTKPEYYPTVAQLNGDKYLKKLSVAALETLSIIAYKQPITKSEIEAIRGVNSDYSIQKLLEKDLIIISGRKEDAVGKPLIYTTSKSFMDYFGLNSPEDLPQIKEILQEEIAHPTLINEANFQKDTPNINEEEDEGYLAVSETGELLHAASSRNNSETIESLEENEDELKNQVDEDKSTDETEENIDVVSFGDGEAGYEEEDEDEDEDEDEEEEEDDEKDEDEDDDDDDDEEEDDDDEDEEDEEDEDDEEDEEDEDDEEDEPLNHP